MDDVGRGPATDPRRTGEMNRRCSISPNPDSQQLTPRPAATSTASDPRTNAVLSTTTLRTLSVGGMHVGSDSWQRRTRHTASRTRRRSRAPSDTTSSSGLLGSSDVGGSGGGSVVILGHVEAGERETDASPCKTPTTTTTRSRLQDTNADLKVGACVSALRRPRRASRGISAAARDHPRRAVRGHQPLRARRPSLAADVRLLLPGQVPRRRPRRAARRCC